MMVHQAFLITMVAACALGAVIDLRTGSIPNWLTLGLLAIAPLLHAVIAGTRAHSPAAALAALGMSVAGAVVSALLPAVLCRVGGLGLGDVKLFAAIGAACGAFVGLYAQTYAYVVAMAYAVVWVARRGRLASTLANVRWLVAARGDKRAPDAQERRKGFTEVRFGPAIAAGMWIAAWALWRKA